MEISRQLGRWRGDKKYPHLGSVFKRGEKRVETKGKMGVEPITLHVGYFGAQRPIRLSPDRKFLALTLIGVFLPHGLRIGLTNHPIERPCKEFSF